MPRDVNEEARDVARALMNTPQYERSRDERKKVEMRFAHLKTHHRFERKQAIVQDAEAVCVLSQYALSDAQLPLSTRWRRWSDEPFRKTQLHNCVGQQRHRRAGVGFPCWA